MSRKIVYIMSVICAISVVCILSFNFLTYEGDYKTISKLYNNAYADMLSSRSTSVDSVTKQIAQVQQNGNVTVGQNGQNGQNNNVSIPGGSDLGSQVVQEALKYVGNPYVWGGDSLTNGCDCSGFVVQIYKLFGVDLSASRQSSLLRSVGNAVSRNDMLPGDIVCYSGHVAIYAGNGKIVEAQCARAGITSNRSVDNKPILAIRRVLNY